MSAAARRLADAIRGGAPADADGRGQHVATIIDLSPLRVDVAGLDLELGADDVALGSLTESLELAVGDNLIVVEVDDGEWVAVEAVGPAVPSLAAHSADTTNVHGIADTAQLLLADDSRGWEPGDIKTTARLNPSVGWIRADGQAITVAMGLPKLRAALIADGSPYGVDGSANPRVPNLNDKVVVGRSGTKALGATGGEETHTLTPGETAMKAHSHGGSTGNDTPDHTHNYGRNLLTDSGVGNANVTTGGGGYQVSVGPTPGRNSFHTHPITAEAAANGTPHNNMQPWIGLTYVIKT